MKSIRNLEIIKYTVTVGLQTPFYPLDNHLSTTTRKGEGAVFVRAIVS
jgi:hypothetical protein